MYTLTFLHAFSKEQVQAQVVESLFNVAYDDVKDYGKQGKPHRNMQFDVHPKHPQV